MRRARMNEDEIALDAVIWLIHIRDHKENYDTAFWDWLKTSPTHLKVFMEFMQLAERLESLS